MVIGGTAGVYPFIKSCPSTNCDSTKVWYPYLNIETY